MLYHLESDPGETSDLSASHPGVAAEMVERWDHFSTNTGVVVAEEAARVPRECESFSREL